MNGLGNRQYERHCDEDESFGLRDVLFLFSVWYPKYQWVGGKQII